MLRTQSPESPRGGGCEGSPGRKGRERQHLLSYKVPPASIRTPTCPVVSGLELGTQVPGRGCACQLGQLD